MPEVLGTEHCNYIIWRYLQEFGYGATAVQFMREWRQPDPQKLPFASAVKPRELVALFIHGLKFDEAAFEYRQEPRRFTFLHEGAKRDELHPDEQTFPPAPGDNVESPRKRQKLDSGSSSARQSKQKKPSAISQAVESEGQQAKDEAGTPREEVAPEPPKPPPTTAELGADAQVQTEEPPKPPVAKTLYKEKIPGADIIHVAFHPTDANILETAGGSVLRKLKVMSESEGTGDINHVEIEVSDMSQEKERPFFITAYSRSPKGEQTALAVEHGDHRTISFGKGSFPQLGPTHKIVLSLRWDPAAKLVLATMGSKDDSGSALLWDNKNSRAVAELSLDKPALDATWLSSDRFALVGEAFIDMYRFNTKENEDEVQSPVVLSKSIQTDIPWDTIRCDPGCSFVACGSASENGPLGVVEVNSDSTSMEIVTAHAGALTGLQWQPRPAWESKPLPQSDVLDQSKQATLLASSSVDGTIKLWDVTKKTECVHTFETEAAKPIVAVAFSPDGKHIAGASEDRTLCIWEAKADGKIVAVWSPNSAEEGLVNGNTNQHPSPVAAAEPNGDHIMHNGVDIVESRPQEMAPKSETLDNEQADEQTKTNGETKFSPPVKEGGPPVPTRPVLTPVLETNADEEDQEESYHALSWNVDCDKLAYGCGDLLSIIYLPQCRNEVYRLPRRSEPERDENVEADSASNLAREEEVGGAPAGEAAASSAVSDLIGESEMKTEAHISEQPTSTDEDMSSAAKQAAVETTETKDGDVTMGNTEEANATTATVEENTNVETS